MEVYIENNCVHVVADSFQQTIKIEKPRDMALCVQGCNFDMTDSLFVRFICWLTGIKRDTVGVLINDKEK